METLAILQDVWSTLNVKCLNDRLLETWWCRVSVKRAKFNYDKFKNHLVLISIPFASTLQSHSVDILLVHNKRSLPMFLDYTALWTINMEVFARILCCLDPMDGVVLLAATWHELVLFVQIMTWDFSIFPWKLIESMRWECSSGH